MKSFMSISVNEESALNGYRLVAVRLSRLTRWKIELLRANELGCSSWAL